MPILCKTIAISSCVVSPGSLGRERRAWRLIAATLTCGAWLAVGADASGAQGATAASPAAETLSGRVVSDLDAPIAGALVRVITSGTERADEIRTEADGLFTISGVQRPLTLVVRAGGYVPASQSLIRPADGYHGLQSAARSPILIRLERVTEISGTVRGADGAPMAGALIDVYQRAQSGTRRSWSSAREPTLAGADGHFLVGNLPPGEFVVAVPILATTLPRAVMDVTRQRAAGTDALALVALERSRAPGAPGPPAPGVLLTSWVTNISSRRLPPLPLWNPPRTYRTTYYPAATTLNDAGVITLSSGERRDGVDVTMQTSAAVVVRGVLMDGDTPAAFTGLRLISADADETNVDLDAQVAVTATDRDGSFSFLNVPQGRYVLKATVLQGPEDGNGPIVPPAAQLRRWTDVALTADRPIVDLGAVPLHKPVTVHGRIVLDDRPLPVDGARLDVNVRASGVVSVGPPGLVQPAPDGRFDLSGLIKGRYELSASGRITPGSGGAPVTYRLERIVADGRDITRVPLVVADRDLEVTITLTQKTGGIVGTVRQEDGRRAPNAQVVVVPQDVKQWMADGVSSRVIARIDATDEAAYAVPGLPAGAYVTIALPADQLSHWPDPRVVDVISRIGIPVRIAEGQWTSLDVPWRSSLPPLR